MNTTRRRFLQLSGALAGYGILSPVWMRVGALASVADAAGPPAATTRKVLVLVLDGGNDGLNTVVPYGLGDYYAKRPSIAIPASRVLPLADSHQVGLHPNLARLHALYTQRQVAVVQGVGYDNPDLSHFGSMDVWQSGSPTHQQSSGWLGRYLDLTPDRGSVVRAVSIGSTLPKILVGDAKSGVAIPSFGGFTFYDGLDVKKGSEAYRLHEAFAPSTRATPASGDPVVDALAAADRAAVAAVHAVNSLGDTTAAPPQTASDKVSMAMTLLSSKLGIDVALVSVTGFDEHAAEQAGHDSLLSQLDAAIGRFADEVSRSAHPESYLLVTISEFGRRAEENGSRGTDHGTAAPQFVVGRGVAGGLYGAQPGLRPSQLDANGNLVRTVEYREVYSTILDHWLGGASSADVLGVSSADGLHPVPFLRTAT